MDRRRFVSAGVGVGVSVGVSVGASTIGASGAVAGLAGATPLQAPTGGRFRVVGDGFTLDGAPFEIRSGEMHFARVPRANWRDRLRKARALGLNTVSTYCFWNRHEPQPGVFDFSGRLDVAAYVRLAQAEGLHVMLRPGPYVCGEWEAGGFPAWLLADPDLRVRTPDPRYLKPAAAYLKRLAQEVAPLEIDRGGPIILTQVENEYGSFGEDHAYMAQAHAMLRGAGFGGMLYTADGAAVLDKGALPGVVAGIDFAATDKAQSEFAAFDKVRPGAPRLCSEIWTGWFDHFGETHQTVPTQPLIENLEWMIGRKASFNLYMLHGGTSFGFDAGANFDKARGYLPDISSYDYDALLDEAGRPTAKYLAVQALLKRAPGTPASLPPLPAPEPVVSIPRFDLSEQAPLSQLYGRPITAAAPRTFEACGLAHGLMLYRHRLTAPVRGELEIAGVHDHARVRLGGRALGALERSLGAARMPLSGEAGEGLEVLAAAFGRINYGEMTGRDPKGLIGPVTLGGAPLVGWEHVLLPLDDLSGLSFAQGAAFDEPAFHRGGFTLDKPGYSFLDMRGWGLGYAWVNGHNLGRFNSAGPQRHLFAPAEWLRVGVNTVVVLDLDRDGRRSLAGGPDPIWDVAATGRPA